MNNTAQNLVIKKNSERAALWMPYDEKFAYHMISELKAHYNEQAKAWVFKPMQIEEVKDLIRKWKEGKLEEPASAEPSKPEEPVFETTDETSPWEKAKKSDQTVDPMTEKTTPQEEAKLESPEETKNAAVHTERTAAADTDKPAAKEQSADPAPVTPGAVSKPKGKEQAVQVDAAEAMKKMKGFYPTSDKKKMGEQFIDFYLTRLTDDLPKMGAELGKEKAVEIYNSRLKAIDTLKEGVGNDKYAEMIGSEIYDRVREKAQSACCMVTDDTMYEIIDDILASCSDVVLKQYDMQIKKEIDRKKSFERMMKNTSKIKSSSDTKDAVAKAKAALEKARAEADKAEKAYKDKKSSKEKNGEKKDEPNVEPAAEKEEGSEESQISLI